MGAPTVKNDIILNLRKYSRAKTVEVTINFGSFVLIGVSIETLKMLVKSVMALARVIGRIPTWLQVSLFAGALIVALHPKSRKLILEALIGVSKNLREVARSLEPLFIEIIETWHTERLKSAILGGNRENVTTFSKTSLKDSCICGVRLIHRTTIFA